MTTGLFDPEGGADPELTGLESRTLRALTHLERRHVAILAGILGLGDVTTERVGQWENSKGRGYPARLVEALRDVVEAVLELGDQLAGDARRAVGRVTIVRPRGAMRIMELLRLPDVAGLRFSDQDLRALEEGGGDFWQRLCDAAVTRAALRLNLETDLSVHVEFDHRPGADPTGQ